MTSNRLIERLENVLHGLETPAAREYLWGYYRDELGAIVTQLRAETPTLPPPVPRFWTDPIPKRGPYE